MDASFTIDPKQIPSLSVPETGKVSEILGRTRLMNNLTLVVRAEWGELSPEWQDAFKTFAYSEHEEIQPKNPIEWIRRFRSALAMSRVFRKEPEIVREYLNAASNLTQAILDAVEQESSEYQEVLNQAIEEALSDTNRRTMNAEEARESNQQLFDRAFE